MSDQTVEKTVQIVNRRGLHARAAAKFVRLVESCGSEIIVSVCKDDHAVSGASIMGLLMLSASKDCCIRIIATGPDAQTAVTALADLVSRRFDEEE